MIKKTDLTDSCACCDEIDCINLFCHKDDEAESVGGELYIYKQLNHKKLLDGELNYYICPNGILLECSCYIIETLNELLPNDYLAIISKELVRDMKASFYLAMSGRYRQAILIQRCVFENFLYGMYFSTKYSSFSRNKDDYKDLKKEFDRWLTGDFKPGSAYIRNVILLGRTISREENKRWKDLYKELSRFVHTIMKTPTGKAIEYENFEIKSCLSKVEFDKDSLIEWSKYYQTVFFLILNKLLYLYPPVKQEEAGKLALKLLRVNFNDKRREINNPDLDKILRMRARKIIK